MKMLKKPLAVFVALCLVFSLLPLAAFAADADAPSIVDYSVGSVEHDDADKEANQIIVIKVLFDENIKLLSDDLSGDIDVLISGQNVLETGREVTYEADGDTLVITLRSTDPDGFYAVYGGLLNVNEAAGGIRNIVSAADETPVQWTNLETYIPIGIVLENEQTTGTADVAASTTVTVTHKANMRGMYHFQLLSNGVPVIDFADDYYYAGSMTSHAHAFYTSITKEYIASAIASAINSNCEGYTATYTEGESLTVTADEAKEGEVLTVQMFEYNADGRTVDPLLRSAAANGQSYLDSDVAYTTATANVLKKAVQNVEALIGTKPSLQAQADAKAAVAAAIDGLEVAQGLSIVDFSVGNVEHDDADAEANQIIVINVRFSDQIQLLSDDLSGDIDVLISGQNVLNTGREVTYQANGDTLVITLRSPDPDGFYAVFGGLLNVNEAEGGIQNIVAADGVIDATNPVPVVWTDLETYIPIGIELANARTPGTASSAASTTVTVTHKANMRGMYHFQLLSNGEPVLSVETSGYYYAGAMTSHAHLFYTTITEAAIASAIASAINSNCEGYTATYTEGASLTVTADVPTNGEVLTVQMFEYNADGRTVDPLLRKAAADGESYLNGDVTYPAKAVAVLENAISNTRALIGKNPTLQAQADAKAAVAAAIDGLTGSSHPYAGNTDETWTYTLAGADYGVIVTFDEQTKTESNYDFIYIYDAGNNEIGKYSGTALAGASVTVPTSTFTIRLTSDSSVNYYGFQITGIEAAPAPVVLPESEHNYANNADETWTYTLAGADDGVVITFDEQTQTESGYDFIYIYDANDNEIGKYSGTELAGASVAVPTSTFTIRLTSDSSANAWGFAVTSVVPVEKGNLAQAGTATVADIPSIMLGRDSNEPVPVVTYMGEQLTAGTDFTVSYEDNDQAGTATVIITGAGSYRGTLTTTFQIADADHLLTPASVYEGAKVLLRQTADWDPETLTSYSGASSYVRFAGVTDDWAASIETITLTPVDADGSATDTGDAVYPHAPKTITFTQDDLGTKWFVKGDYIYFYRTSVEPVVYVMEGHEPLDIVGRWSTITYPQSQTYAVTVTADKYEDSVGTITYYTGTSPEFSIIVVEEDGTETVAASWTSEEIAEMATFANGSSQCGMTGFRTFSGEGVALRDLLALAGVEVSETDSFLLDTSDHYGNTFTYESLFGTTRYFLESIYTDPELADTYHQLVTSDDAAGATLALRQLLAEKALEADSTVEPRINVNYNETLISGDQVGSTPLPTKENTAYSELVSYENQFRFYYGIALTSDETATVTFNSNGGSAVEAQVVKASPLTSTENTTIKSSYWANSLVIYRGQGQAYTPAPADRAIEPTTTRPGYTFAGWYTDEDCTPGNEFNFHSAVDGNITLYAKWVRGSDNYGNGGASGGSGTSLIPGSSSGGSSIIIIPGVTLPYTDVQSGDWYYSAVAYMYRNGIMTGVTTTTFEPALTVTRATIVTMLHRLEGAPTAASANFTDVAPGQWYTAAVDWAAANGVVNGYGNGNFGPNDPLTREQTAVILYRYAQLKGYNTSATGSLSGYTDAASVSAYATQAMQWAVGNGLITSASTSELVLNPLGSATRAEIATLLTRFMVNIK